MNISIGQNFIKEKKFLKAENFFLKLLDSGNKTINVYFFLGIANFELRNYEKSITYYNKCLELDPKSIQVLINLAYVKESYGKIEEAKKIYLKIIQLNNNIIRSYYGLYNLNPKFLTESHFERINYLEKNVNLSLFDKSLCEFLLSKKEKKRKNYKLEIEYLKKFHNDSFNSNIKFNKTSQIYYNEIICNFFDKIEYKNYEKSNFIKEISPIFIIGLPRSGSTLVEAILTSGKSNLITFGENHSINMSVLDQIGKKIFSEEFDASEFKFQIDYNKFKEDVLYRYQQYIPMKKNTKIFLDKSLENFYNIDLIVKVFPKAKFLHCYRNSIDAILSIYDSMLFQLSWAHKIDDIMVYINNNKKVIKYFKQKYPLKILDIELKQLTLDEIKISKKIFKFCDLKWDKKSLEFYKRKDLKIRTLSNTQIRNKITKYDSKKYQPYRYLIKGYEKKYNWIANNT